LVGADELGEAEVWAQGEKAQSLEVIDKEVNRVAVLSGLKNGTLFLINNAFIADLAERLGSGKDELMLLAIIGCLCVQTLKPIKARDSVCDDVLF